MPVFNRTLGALNYESPQAVQSIANHIRVMQEELEYRLAHLDSENIPEIDLDVTKFMQKGQEVNNIIADGDRLSQFEQTVEGFRMQVQEYEEAVNGYSLQVSTFELTVDGLKTEVSQYKVATDGYSYQVSQFEQTVKGFSTTVESYEKTVDGYSEQLSTFDQTVKGFNTTVQEYKESVDGYSARVSSFEQTVDRFTLQVSSYEEAVDGYSEALSHTLTLDATGVYIVDQDGKVVSISGGQIKANSITTDKLKLTGLLEIYKNADAVLPGGYMGYAVSLENGASGMQIASSNRYLTADLEVADYGFGEVGVTDSGARMVYAVKDVSEGTVNRVVASVYSTGFGVSVYETPYYFTTDALWNQAHAGLGRDNHPWGQIYSTNSAISTSDRNAKNSIEYDIDPRYDVLWSLLKPCTGKYNDGTSDRTHMFLISQDVEDAIEQAGLTSKDFAAFIKSPKEDAEGNVIDGYVYALRYEEFVPLCIRHIQMLEARVAQLETR